jgi:hypothetical protein
MQAATKVGPGLPLPNIGIESLRGPVTETPDEWNARRKSIYADHRKIFITHIIKPSSSPGRLSTYLSTSFATTPKIFLTSDSLNSF